MVSQTDLRRLALAADLHAEIRNIITQRIADGESVEPGEMDAGKLLEHGDACKCEGDSAVWWGRLMREWRAARAALRAREKHIADSGRIAGYLPLIRDRVKLDVYWLLLVSGRFVSAGTTFHDLNNRTG